jgi:hypothetical protein
MEYPPGPYVSYSELVKSLHGLPYNSLIADMVKDLPKYAIPTNSEAEELLTKICSDAFQCIYEDYSTSTWIHQLNDWWSKHKPKSERDKKLEAIIRSISLNGQFTENLLPVAERVLQALGL